MIWLIEFIGLSAWIWFLYKLHDFLSFRQGMKGEKATTICIVLLFAALFFIGWINGVPIFGDGDGCYGTANSSTC